MSGVVRLIPARGRARIEHLEKENAALRKAIDAAYAAIKDGRRGDALALLRPKSITAPIAASGDQA